MVFNIKYQFSKPSTKQAQTEEMKNIGSRTYGIKSQISILKNWGQDLGSIIRQVQT